MYVTTYTISYTDYNGNSDVNTFVKELDARDFVRTTIEDFLSYEGLGDEISTDDIEYEVNDLFNLRYVDYHPSEYAHIEFMYSMKCFDVPGDKVAYVWKHQLRNTNWVIDPNRIAYFHAVTETVGKIKPNGWDHAVYKKTDNGCEYIVLCGEKDSDEGRYIPVNCTSAAYALTLVMRCAFDE